MANGEVMASEEVALKAGKQIRQKRNLFRTKKMLLGNGC
jgi:hypothetical protein